MTAHECPQLGAGILQNADVTERPNVWPAGRRLKQDRWLQARLGSRWLLGAPPRHLLSRLFQGCGRQGGRGLVEQGRAWGVVASVTSPDFCTASRGERAPALPVDAYCCAVSGRINGRRGGDASAGMQSVRGRSPAPPRMDRAPYTPSGAAYCAGAAAVQESGTGGHPGTVPSSGDSWRGPVSAAGSGSWGARVVPSVSLGLTIRSTLGDVKMWAPAGGRVSEEECMCVCARVQACARACTIVCVCARACLHVGRDGTRAGTEVPRGTSSGPQGRCL